MAKDDDTEVMEVLPEAYQRLLVRCSDAIGATGERMIVELAAEGVDRNATAWLLSQACFSISVSAHHAAGLPLEEFLEHVRVSWRAVELATAAASKAATP